jgi:hypothetical protein
MAFKILKIKFITINIIIIYEKRVYCLRIKHLGRQSLQYITFSDPSVLVITS